MEKAILKTLEYYNSQDYPLKAYEIHKWLINKKASLPQVEKALTKLTKKLKVKSQKDYYFLFNRKGLIKKRLIKEKNDQRKFRWIKILAFFSRVIPWIKFMGWDNQTLFVVSQKNRLSLSKVSLEIILKLLEQRIKVRFLEEDKITFRKDPALAHQILNLKVLINRENTYSAILEQNPWFFKILPNWTSNVTVKKSKAAKKRFTKLDNESFYFGSLVDGLEYLVKNLQLKFDN